MYSLKNENLKRLCVALNAFLRYNIKKSKTNLEEVDALDDVEIDDDVDTELVVEKLKTNKKKLSEKTKDKSQYIDFVMTKSRPKKNYP